MSTPVAVVIAVLLAAILAVLGRELPEIRRYLKMRSM
jgi:hypothetical protein